MALGLLQGGVAVSTLVHQQRPDVAVERHLALRGQARRECVNRHADVMAAHPQWCRAAVGQRHDGFGAQMVRGEQRAHGNRLVDAGKGFAGEVGVQCGVFGFFGLQADVGHLFNRLQRVFARSGFSAQHHRVGAIEHGVGHVADLSACRYRIENHAFHHLRGSNHHLVLRPGHFDHALLQGRHSSVADFYRQIAPGHHDAVADAQNVLQIGNGFSAFDLRNQTRLVFERRCCHVAELARHLHVGGVFRKAHRHIVGLKTHGGADVFHVFGSQSWRGQSAALFVDALVVGQLAAQLDGGVHLFTAHQVDGQHNQAVVEQQHIAHLHIAR